MIVVNYSLLNNLQINTPKREWRRSLDLVISGATTELQILLSVSSFKYVDAGFAQ